MTRALIIGSAACLWDDLSALGMWDGLVIAVNRAGVSYPHRIDHWVTLHPEFLQGWMEERAIEWGVADYTVWSQKEHDWAEVDRVVRDIEPLGSSGLFATRIALKHLRCRRVVLAGIPIDDTPHFYDGGLRSGPSFECYRPEWIRAHRLEFNGKVRSMSGWTGGRLKKPDAGWLVC